MLNNDGGSVMRIYVVVFVNIHHCKRFINCWLK